MSEIRYCSHPNCNALAITETDAAGFVCRGHFDCAFEITQGEQRLMIVETQRNELLDALRLSVKAVEACHSVLLLLGGDRMPTVDSIVDRAKAVISKVQVGQ